MPVDLSPAPVAPAVGSSPALSANPSPAPTTNTPAASQAEGGSVMESFDKQFSDLDTPSTPPAAPAAADKPPAEKPPKAESPPNQPAATPAEKPGEDEFEGPQVGTLREVRDFGKRMAGIAKNATAAKKQLEARIAELEARTAEPPPDIQKIQQAYQLAQEELKEHRARLIESDYSKSPDYKKEFEQPYEQAYLRGRSTVQALVVKEVDAENNATTRPGTAEDFDRLYNMTDSEADAAAESMFGPSARRVIAIRDAAKERAVLAVNAIKEKAAEFAQKRTTNEAQTAQQRLALQGLWKKVNTDLQTKHEKFFGEHPEDNEWNEALSKGRGIAAQKFSDAYGKLAPEQRVILDAQIFNRAAAFPALKLALERAEKERDEFKKNLEALRGSGPGKPDAAGGSQGGEAKDWSEEFDRRV